MVSQEPRTPRKFSRCITGTPFTQEQEQYIIDLRENHSKRLDWQGMSTKFNERYPDAPRSKGALQVHYSRSLQPAKRKQTRRDRRPERLSSVKLEGSDDSSEYHGDEDEHLQQSRGSQLTNVTSLTVETSQITPSSTVHNASTAVSEQESEPAMSSNNTNDHLRVALADAVAYQGDASPSEALEGLKPRAPRKSYQEISMHLEGDTESELSSDHDEHQSIHGAEGMSKVDGHIMQPISGHASTSRSTTEVAGESLVRARRVSFMPDPTSSASNDRRMPKEQRFLVDADDQLLVRPTTEPRQSRVDSAVSGIASFEPPVKRSSRIRSESQRVRQSRETAPVRPSRRSRQARSSASRPSQSISSPSSPDDSDDLVKQKPGKPVLKLNVFSARDRDASRTDGQISAHDPLSAPAPLSASASAVAAGKKRAAEEDMPTDGSVKRAKVDHPSPLWHIIDPASLPDDSSMPAVFRNLPPGRVVEKSNNGAGPSIRTRWLRSGEDAPVFGTTVPGASQLVASSA